MNLISRLRDLSLQDKNEISGLKKSNEELTTKIKATTKENETLKEEAAVFKSQINELKDQVSSIVFQDHPRSSSSDCSLSVNFKGSSNPGFCSDDRAANRTELGLGG